MVKVCNRCLKPIIEKFKKQDMTVFEPLYDLFKRLIMLYSKKLYYDDAAGELTLFFIELLYSIDLSKFHNDDSVSLKKYIAVAIKNRYIALSVNKERYGKVSNKLYDNLEGYLPNFEEHFSLLESINVLSDKQRQIVIYKYIYGYSDFEIAVLLGISRQAVNRLKNRALKCLREFFAEETVDENTR